MLVSLIFAVVFAVMAVFFANDNQGSILLDLFGLPLEGKLGIVVVMAFGLGALIGIVLMLPAYLSQGWALIRSRRKSEDLERALRQAGDANQA